MTGDLTRLVLFANVASMLMLVGLIWFVQVVHCPQFARVGIDRFTHSQSQHFRLTTWVVALPMLVEAVTSVALVWKPPAQDLELASWGGLSMVIVIWVSMAVLQVPRLNALTTGFDFQAHRGLVLSNRIRTVAWSMRGGLELILHNQMVERGLDDGQ